MSTATGQRPYRVRFDWGPAGVDALAAGVVVVVDVLRFTTAVEAAVSRGVAVRPYRWRDRSADELAAEVGAVLADAGGSPGSPSLSPASLLGLAPGTQVVLPSPNGSTCAARAAEAGAQVAAACLRNAAAVGAWLARQAGPVAVIAAGERWPDGSLRPCLEDHLGAGAVLAGLLDAGGGRGAEGGLSPEAQAAVAAWRDGEGRVADLLPACASGRELRERGREDDVRYASAVGAGRTVPVLVDGAFRDASGGAATRPG